MFLPSVKKLERRDPLDEEDLQNTDEKPIFPKVQYGSGFEEKGFASNLSNNPWNVINAEVFLKYCCPECEFKSEEFFIFSQHALTNHTLSNALFGDGNSFEKSSYEYPYSEKSQRIEVKCEPEEVAPDDYGAYDYSFDSKLPSYEEIIEDKGRKISKTIFKLATAKR